MGDIVPAARSKIKGHELERKSASQSPTLEEPVLLMGICLINTDRLGVAR
jgi:hypothetical protein